MSSFSSVVQKPGKKIVPKAAPRRNVQRKPARSPVIASIDVQPETQHNDQIGAQIEDTIETNQEVQSEQTEQEQDETRVLPEPPAVREVAAHVLDRPKIPDVPFEEITGISVSGVPSEPAAPSVVLTQDLPPPHAQGNLATNEIERAHATVIESAQKRPPPAAEPQPAQESSPAVNPQPPNNSSPITQPKPREKAVDINANTSTPRKKRRTTLQTASEADLVQAIATTPNAPIAPSLLHNLTASRRRSSQSQQPEDLFESATRRAASVSQLANDINSQTRLLQHGSDRNTTHDIDNNLSSHRVSASPLSQQGRKRRKKTLQEQAVAVVANAVSKRGTSSGHRGSTPENAEEYELEPAKVKMAELCEDRRLGKKSALETEMQANWSDIVQRRKEDRERALANAEKRRRRGIGQKHQLNISDEPVVALAPAMSVVNGIIVVDQASREIDRSAQLQQAAFQDLDNVREDKDYYKYVNQGTVGVKPGHGQHTRWDEESNDRFFQGLRMFGTDFLMIANMFPGLTRKQIKSKFIREENADRARVRECLRNRQPVQLEDYASMANRGVEEFHTMESIQKELDEQEKRLRDEDNERRKREGFVTSADGIIQPSATEGNDGDIEGQTVSAEPGRFDAAAREIVEAAVGPKRRQRKANTVSGKRGPKGGRRPEGGIEEILGNIHEVAV